MFASIIIYNQWNWDISVSLSQTYSPPPPPPPPPPEGSALQEAPPPACSSQLSVSVTEARGSETALLCWATVWSLPLLALNSLHLSSQVEELSFSDGGAWNTKLCYCGRQINVYERLFSSAMLCLLPPQHFPNRVVSHTNYTDIYSRVLC